MKKVIFLAGSIILLASCNQPENHGAGHNADSASHNAHNSNDSGSANKGSSGNTSDQSMMSLMETNMDQMKEMKSLGSSDKDFAAIMKIHHTGALEMAQLQLAQGNDPQLKSMAQKMIDAQKREIKELDAFLAGNNTQTNSPSDQRSPFYEKVIKEMDGMEMDHAAHSGSVDQQFVQMMIPHHQSGIAMADVYLKNGAQDQSLKAIANAIKTDQQKEIQQMQAWMASRK